MAVRACSQNHVIYKLLVCDLQASSPRRFSPLQLVTEVKLPQVSVIVLVLSPGSQPAGAMCMFTKSCDLQASCVWSTSFFFKKVFTIAACDWSVNATGFSYCGCFIARFATSWWNLPNCTRTSRPHQNFPSSTKSVNWKSELACNT